MTKSSSSRKFKKKVAKMTKNNPVHKFLVANQSSLVIEGQATEAGHGRYKLENGKVHHWLWKDMEDFLSHGGSFEPKWNLNPKGGSK